MDTVTAEKQLHLLLKRKPASLEPDEMEAICLGCCAVSALNRLFDVTSNKDIREIITFWHHMYFPEDKLKMTPAPGYRDTRGQRAGT